MNDFLLLEELPSEPYHRYKQYEHVVVPSKFEEGPEDRPVMGKVLSKGDRCSRDAIRIGAIAISGKWSGARFPQDGKSYILLRESDVLAIIEA